MKIKSTKEFFEILHSLSKKSSKIEHRKSSVRFFKPEQSIGIYYEDNVAFINKKHLQMFLGGAANMTYTDEQKRMLKAMAPYQKEGIGGILTVNTESANIDYGNKSYIVVYRDKCKKAYYISEVYKNDNNLKGLSQKQIGIVPW